MPAEPSTPGHAWSGLVYPAVLGLIIGLAVGLIGWQKSPYGAWLGLVPPVLFVWLAARKALRRRRAASGPFPTAWRTWLERHLPFYAGLDRAGRRQFEERVQHYLAEQTFEGVGGVAVTDELRLAVAAGVAFMLHGRPGWAISTQRTVLFYPEGFDSEYLFEDTGAEFDGMVHGQGPLILSAPAVLDSWDYPTDGSNVVLHELAHLLDYSGAEADGVPSLIDPASLPAWNRLVEREMQAVKIGKSLLRGYAATNPAEFFAVAVENFFERPDLLQRRHPDLFEALSAFFNLDPREALKANS